MEEDGSNRIERFHQACQRSVIEQVPWLAELDDRERLAVETVMTHLVEQKFAADFGLEIPTMIEVQGSLSPKNLQISPARLDELREVWGSVFWSERNYSGMARYVLTMLRYGDVVFHILPQNDWESAQKAGTYQPASLAKEGFIHCSRIEQVLRSANNFFKGQDDLLLLCIAADRLEAEIRYEDLMGEGIRFPHIYGPLNLDAVVETYELQKDPEGLFTLPG